MTRPDGTILIKAGNSKSGTTLWEPASRNAIAKAVKVSPAVITRQLDKNDSGHWKLPKYKNKGVEFMGEDKHHRRGNDRCIKCCHCGQVKPTSKMKKLRGKARNSCIECFDKAIAGLKIEYTGTPYDDTLRHTYTLPDAALSDL